MNRASSSTYLVAEGLGEAQGSLLTSLSLSSQWSSIGRDKLPKSFNSLSFISSIQASIHEPTLASRTALTTSQLRYLQLGDPR